MRLPLFRAPLLLSLVCVLASTAAAQTATPEAKAEAARPSSSTATDKQSDAAETVESRLREQREEIEALRALVLEQTRLVKQLQERVERAEQLAAATHAPGSAVVRETSYSTAPSSTSAPAETAATNGATTQDAKLEDRVARAEKAVEAVSRQLAGITFFGDLRFRYEAIYGQQNALATADAAAAAGALGNPLTSRQRLRLRARFGARGQLGRDFEWGIRLATGSFADTIAANQTLTDFYNRKPFGLDNAYLTWRPSAVPGLQVQGGKFETPWLRTELTWDSDINVEGLSESYTRRFEKSKLRSLTFIAWELPMLERNAAFVLNADGTVDLSASRRGGRDLALYGAQARALFEPSKRIALTLSAADLYFNGTQFITPVQFFGPNVQFPVAVTIPASGTTPARTVTAQVSIPRDFLTAGNTTLGVSTATNNATNRDGRLSSGFNLVDLIARLDLRHSERWPAVLLFNYVRNTQAHAVVAAGPGGADVLLPNDENDGVWAEFQIGRTQKRGDTQFGYTFIRIEKDAVLTPFNASDIGFQSDSRVHRFSATYTADPRVLLVFTGFVSQRANGLLGPFATTPPDSLDRTLTRLQFDTIFRF